MKQSAPPAPQQPMTLEQRLKIANALAHYPALTLMVVMRRDIGFRVLSPLALTVIAVVMVLISGIVAPEHRPQDLIAFALLAPALGLFQRYVRWMEFKRGEQQHSRYIGTSPFELPFMPGFLLTDRRLGRYADPLIALVAGIALIRVSPALGAWICFSALCLRLNEFVAYRAHIHESLDIVDGMSQSEIQSQTVDRFSGKPETPKEEPQAGGIPTGIGPDIQRKPQGGSKSQDAAAKPQVQIGLWNFINAKPKLSRANVILAFLVAIIADSLYFVAHYILGWLSNYFSSGLDSFSRMLEFGVNCVAMTATVILLGFHWALVPSIFMPFLPVQYRIPTWTGCVAFVVWQRRKDSTPVDEKASGDADPASPTPDQRMQHLNECRSKGWISEEEFEFKRRQILEEI